MGPTAGLIALLPLGLAADAVPWLADARTRIEAQRGLAFDQPVTVVVQSEDELLASVREELDEELPPDRARAWSRAMEAFGVVAPGFDVRAELERLLGQHVAGYYNPDTRELFLVARPEDAPLEQGAKAERKVAEHELVHALQDQHFDLFDLTRRELDNDDAGLAIRALIEGDATATMMDALAGELGVAIDDPQVAHAMDDIGQLSASSAAQLGDGLPFIVGPMVFPYIHGTRLTLSLYEEGGWEAVDDAYRTRLPLSTEQVLHPDKLLGPNPDWPTILDLPRTLGARWALLDDGTLGELGTRLLIEHHLAGAWVEAAAGWDGDRYEVYEDRRGSLALVWLSTWDSEADASAFADAASRMALPGGVDVVHDGLDVVVVSGTAPRRPCRRALRKAGRREVHLLDDLAPRVERP